MYDAAEKRLQNLTVTDEQNEIMDRQLANVRVTVELGVIQKCRLPVAACDCDTHVVTVTLM